MIASFVVASTALFAGSALASGLGQAVIINNCDYQVHLCAVPATGGGQSQTDKILNTGDIFTQQWTPLTNTMGWSIKLSKTEVMRNIMQYEYTYNGDSTLWWDMSEVDGNPWNGNFMITADGSRCSPRQVAYRYSNDDAYGMQDCSPDSVITLTLCSGDNDTSVNAGASYGSIPQSSSSATPAPVSIPVSSYSQAPPPPAPSTTSSSSTPPPAAVQVPASSYSASPAPAAHSSSSTSSSQAPPPSVAPSYIPVAGGINGVWTTLETVTETDWVTVDTTVTAYATVPARKRHEHHAGRHGRN